MEAKRYQHQKASFHQFKNEQKNELINSLKNKQKTSNEDPKYTQKRIMNGSICNISNIIVE